MFVAVFVSVAMGFCLGSLLACARIAGLKEELSHLWDIVQTAGLTEEGGKRGE